MTGDGARVLRPSICGWTLARAHARSGDRIAIAAYLGASDRFDQALAASPRRTPTRTSTTTPRWPPRAGTATSPSSSSRVSEPYGEAVTWEPDRPRIRPLHRCSAGWSRPPRSGSAAGLLPGVELHQTGAAFAGRARDRAAQRDPAAGARRAAAAVHARRRLPARARRRRAPAACSRPTLLPDDIRVDSFGDALLAALVMAAVSVVLAGDPRHRRRRRVHAARHPPDRAAPGRRIRDRRAGDRVPRDRRPGAAGAARRDARRQRADDGALDRRGRLPAGRVGDRPLVADRREPGRASCSAPTRTSPRSAGSRRSAAG